jgi:uncharacterized membrane protein
MISAMKWMVRAYFLMLVILIVVMIILERHS